MYDRILFPIDGSDRSEVAVNHVRSLATTYDATIHIVFVVEATTPAVGIGGDPNKEPSPGMVGDPEGAETPMVGDREPPEQLRTRARAYGQGLVEEVAGQLRRVETRTVVRGGDAQQVIVDYADSEDVDIIVMGTHGKTGLLGHLLTSVGEHVFQTADVPVMTVREQEVELFAFEESAG